MSKLNNLYSDKQIKVLQYYFQHRPSKIINHGAVRSGKTIIDNDLFIAEVVQISKFMKEKGLKESQYILAGASIGNIEKNVLSELRKKYGIDTKLDKYNRFKFKNVWICCIGHDDIGNLSAITGMTAFGAYINEAHLCHEEVFDEIMKRLSGDMDFHAIAIMDANPSFPTHYLKVNYIDKADGVNIYAMNWTLYDNTFLNREYIEDLEKTTPSGMFYDRKILGRWVSPEGIVYRDFNRKVHIINSLEEVDNTDRFINFFCGVDWGYEHKGSLGLFGETIKGRYVLIKEITAQHQLIEWWIQKAKDLIAEINSKGKKNSVPFYVDSARPDNKRAFNDNGIWAINAKKEVEPGIECVAKRFKNNTLYVFKDGIGYFEKEIDKYVWKNGVPIKIDDDVMDMIRYAVYTRDYEKR